MQMTPEQFAAKLAALADLWVEEQVAGDVVKFDEEEAVRDFTMWLGTLYEVGRLGDPKPN